MTLNVFHRHTDRVKLAAIAQMVNVLQAMILTDGPRMVLTPTYHVFDMYLPFQGATPYPVGVTKITYAHGGTTLPAVDVSAARAQDGKLWLSLTNLDPNKPARVTTALGGTARGRMLTGRALDTHNDFSNPTAIRPVAFKGLRIDGRLAFDLPPKSIAVVHVTE